MMVSLWQQYLRGLLLTLSLGLNLAFVAVWLVQFSANPDEPDESSLSTTNGPITSLLHREIGVTEDQWREIAPWIEDFLESARARRETIATLRGELMALLTAVEVNEADVRSKQEAILASQRQMQNLVIDHLLKERELLSPEQWRRFMALIRAEIRSDSGMASGKGFGRVLDESTIPGGRP
ncbi:MAG: periplasmic heavy metal sensor [Verrucomicrobiota bacterium]|nr:periplasmic heavy metal sensor [Verrucomicrobiota bacterium]